MVAHIRTNHQSDCAMAIHMIRTILRIVLNYKNGQILPEDAMGEGIDHVAQREIVFGQHRTWRLLAGTGAHGVIARKREHLKLGHAALALELPEFLEPDSESLHVSHVLYVVCAGISGIEMPFNIGSLGAHASVVYVRKLAIDTIGQSEAHTEIPKKTMTRVGFRIAMVLRAHLFAAAGISAGPKLLHIIAGIGAVHPIVPRRADLGVVIQVVDQHELPGEGVMIRRDLIGK